MGFSPVIVSWAGTLNTGRAMLENRKRWAPVLSGRRIRRYLRTVAAELRRLCELRTPGILQSCRRGMSGIHRWICLGGWLALGILLAGQQVPSTAQEPAPAQVDSSCVEGERLFRSQQHSAAEPLLQECLRRNGEQGKILLYLTVIALSDARHADATQWGARAVAVAPDSPEARYWFGRALVENGDLVGAQQQWEAGISLATEHVGLLEGLAQLAINKGEDSKAYGLLVQMQRVGVDEAWVHQLLSELTRRRGLWAASLKHWQDYLQRAGESAEALVTAGELSILAGDLEGAVQTCERAVELEPSAETHGALGEALFAASRHEEALSALRQAAALDPEVSRIQFNLANVLEIMGLVDEAEEHFRRYVELAPDDARGHLNYAIHLNRLGRTQEALAQAAAAADLEPMLREARVVQAQIYEEGGQYAEAIGMIDTLLQVDDEDKDELLIWRQRMTDNLAQSEAASNAGKFHLQHIVLADTAAVGLFQTELAGGADFGLLAVRFSVGRTAAAGGDIGWVAPSDMVEPLRSAIAQLKPNEISSVIEMQGRYHVFRRLR